jgi:hypothetical protein
MRDYLIVLNLHVPPGLTDKEQQHGIQHGLRLGVGKQSASQPNLMTSVRPNVPTTYIYDDAGEITGIDEVAAGWLLGGDLSEETWTNDEELLEAIAWRMIEYFDLPDNQILPMKNTLSVQQLDHPGMIAELTNNAEFWGERVGEREEYHD